MKILAAIAGAAGRFRRPARKGRERPDWKSNPAILWSGS
jgi:hypothetical protein